MSEIIAKTLLVLLAVGSLAGQTSQAPPPLNGDAWITGRVLAKSSGASLSDAVVAIAGRSVKTDADGQFSVGPLPAGRWRLTVRKQGYVLAGLDGKPANPTIYSGEGGIYFRVDGGARVSLDLYLLGGGTVSGVVLNDRGQPRLGTRVMALTRYYDERGVLQVRPVAFENTNDLGQFRLYGLMPGTYVIRAGDAAFVPKPTDDILLPRYYPGLEIDKMDAAAAVVVDDTSEVRLNPITVPSVDPRKLRVHVVDESGVPITKSVAGVQARRTGMTYTLMTDFSGTFTVGPGQYEIGVTTSIDFVDPRVSPVSRSATTATAVVEVGDQDRDFDLVVRPSATVTGRISEPISGIQIRFNPLTWPLLPLGTASTADGKFAVFGIPPGTYSVDVPVRGRDLDGGYVSDTDNLSFPEGKCLASLQQGDRDLLRNPLQVSSQNVEIVMGLRDESTRVRGTVRRASGEPAPGVVVALLPDDRSRSADYSSMTTDQDGRFEFRCAEPGAFHLFAWSRLPGFAYRNAEFMKQYDERGLPITLESNADRTVGVTVFAETP